MTSEVAVLTSLTSLSLTLIWFCFHFLIPLHSSSYLFLPLPEDSLLFIPVASPGKSGARRTRSSSAGHSLHLSLSLHLKTLFWERWEEKKMHHLLLLQVHCSPDQHQPWMTFEQEKRQSWWRRKRRSWVTGDKRVHDRSLAFFFSFSSFKKQTCTLFLFSTHFFFLPLFSKLLAASFSMNIWYEYE